MTAATKSSWARIGLGAGVVVGILSSLVACDCPGGFLLAAGFLIFPICWGAGLRRIVAGIICLLCIAAAVQQIRIGYAQKAKRQHQLELHRLPAAPSVASPKNTDPR